MKRILLLLPLALLGSRLAYGQAEGEEGSEESERVQYALILPEEKTPELVKPEENNPFEASTDGRVDDDSSTEENQVRDLLMRMPVGGAVSGTRGMRVMLGGMRLEPGMEVPPVIPDQQVTLRVKSLTPSAIELVWVEKKPTGLPPKVLVIPMDGSPSVRYRMPAGMGGDTPDGGRSMGTLRRRDVSATAPASAADARENAVAETAPSPAPAKREGDAAGKSSSPTPPPSGTPEASVLRMLFGSHPPSAK